MPLWRIRIAVPDSPASRSAVKQALAAHSVSYLRVAPSDDASPATSEIVIELPQGDGFTSVLSALHAISPQVFVSRADPPDATSGRGGRVPEPMPRGTG
jgi:hypothetical protein